MFIVLGVPSATQMAGKHTNDNNNNKFEFQQRSLPTDLKGNKSESFALLRYGVHAHPRINHLATDIFSSNSKQKKWIDQSNEQASPEQPEKGHVHPTKGRVQKRASTGIRATLTRTGKSSVAILGRLHDRKTTTQQRFCTGRSAPGAGHLAYLEEDLAHEHVEEVCHPSAVAHET